MFVNDEVVQYIIVRRDLNMSKGKMAAQCCHASNASFYPYMDDEAVKQWLAGSFVKVILSIKNLNEANKLIDVLNSNDIIHSVIRDNCRTELQPEENNCTLTCIGIKPYVKSMIHPLIKKLQLYKE
jgi:PTH2 family peptidyl-tRNA hydrolase